MSIIHPLINPESKHYVHDGKQSIFEIEESISVDEMIGACTFNIMKDRRRLETKGQKSADLKKIETYRNYRDLLLDMKNKHDCGYMFVRDAYGFCGVEIKGMEKETS